MSPVMQDQQPIRASEETAFYEEMKANFSQKHVQALMELANVMVSRTEAQQESQSDHIATHEESARGPMGKNVDSAASVVKSLGLANTPRASAQSGESVESARSLRSRDAIVQSPSALQCQSKLGLATVPEPQHDSAHETGMRHHPSGSASADQQHASAPVNIAVHVTINSGEGTKLTVDANERSAVPATVTVDAGSEGSAVQAKGVRPTSGRPTALSVPEHGSDSGASTECPFRDSPASEMPITWRRDCLETVRRERAIRSASRTRQKAGGPAPPKSEPPSWSSLWGRQWGEDETHLMTSFLRAESPMGYAEPVDFEDAYAAGVEAARRKWESSRPHPGDGAFRQRLGLLSPTPQRTRCHDLPSLEGPAAGKPLLW